MLREGNSRSIDIDWTSYRCKVRGRPADTGTLTGDIPVTVSIGTTQARSRDTQSTLLRRADEHLYAAKRSGRNRVVSD